MTPYVIFAVVLTIAYIIYYGYNISKDIYGKKNQEDSTEETFDLGITEDQPVPTEVRETGEGFALGDIVVAPTVIETNPETSGEGKGKSEIQQKIEALQNNNELLEADVQSSHGYDQFELSEMLANDKSNVEFRKAGVKATKTNV